MSCTKVLWISDTSVYRPYLNGFLSSRDNVFKVLADTHRISVIAANVLPISNDIIVENKKQKNSIEKKN